MQHLADKILQFYASVTLDSALPQQIQVMNPYAESEEVRRLCGLFYRKYYADTSPRKLILGINPGRLGAGATGIPFTDTKRLAEACDITCEGLHTHEPSSVFIYEMIEAFGGPELFYSQFYINSVCPLGFTKNQDTGQLVNYNYYDSRELSHSVSQFIIDNIHQQIAIAGHRDVAFCLGTGKNYAYLNKLNRTHQFFKEIIPLEHPRYIMQYKNKTKDLYIDDYIRKLTRA
ncbi:MAG: uracil-DNA glycosylase family protein [Saprospiraceae bacterium]